MPIAVMIPDALVKPMKEGLTRKVQSIDSKIEQAKQTIFDLTRVKEDFTLLLAQLNGEIKLAERIGQKEKNISAYHPSLKWSEKVKYFLSLSDEPKTSGEIIDFIISQEPEYGLDGAKKITLAQMISREMSKYKQNKDYKMVGLNNSNKAMFKLLKKQ